MKRSEMRLIQRAVINKWNIPPQLLDVLPTQLVDVIQNGSVAQRLRACQVLVAMNAQNIEVDKNTMPTMDAESEVDFDVVRAVADKMLTRPLYLKYLREGDDDVEADS